MTTKEVQQDLIKSMQTWQGVERQSMSSTGAIIGKSKHPLVLLVMEIIQRDSQLHHRVQQFIIDNLERKPTPLTPEELGEISAQLDHHARLEQQMVDSVAAAQEKIRGRKMLVEEYLLNFLVQDEKKHADLLRALDAVKRGIYPYA